MEEVEGIRSGTFSSGWKSMKWLEPRENLGSVELYYFLSTNLTCIHPPAVYSDQLEFSSNPLLPVQVLEKLFFYTLVYVTSIIFIYFLILYY
jgi:hypothetical protein